MKAVAGSGKAKEGGTQRGKGLWAGKKREADRGSVAGRSLQSCRDKGWQVERGIQEIQVGRQGNR
jgi:hypothetical protein